MAFDTMTLLGYAFGIIVLYVTCLFFMKPLKFIFRILINLSFGGVMIWAINSVGGILGVKLGLNVLTSCIAGYMGIPGVALLYIVKIFV